MARLGRRGRTACVPASPGSCSSAVRRAWARAACSTRRSARHQARPGTCGSSPAAASSSAARASRSCRWWRRCAPLVRTSSPADLDRLLGPARRELARLLPELAVDQTGPPAAGGSTAQLFELVLGVLGRLGTEQPLVLIVEDLHWADRTTLRPGRLPGPGSAGHPRAARAHLPLRRGATGGPRCGRCCRDGSGSAGWSALQLERFDRRETAAQVGAILGALPEPGMVDLIYDRSEGNAVLRRGAGAHGARRRGRARAARRRSATCCCRVPKGSRGPAQRLLRTAAVAGRVGARAAARRGRRP